MTITPSANCIIRPRLRIQPLLYSFFYLACHFFKELYCAINSDSDFQNKGFFF